MKTIKLNVCDVEYPVCFNARVIVEGEKKYGSIEAMDNAVFSESIAFCNFIWLLATMLEAGYRVEKARGTDVILPPSEEELLDIIGLEDIANLRYEMLNARAEDSERKVFVEETEEEKK